MKHTADRDIGLRAAKLIRERGVHVKDQMRGHQYQPFSATAAHLDPAAELGDGITVGSVYGCLCKKNISHGPLYTADISAPGGEKINYQYPWKTLQRRKVERNFRDVSATFKVQAGLISQEVSERKADSKEFRAQFKVQTGLIEAKVSKTGGLASSFGWVLDESSWIIKANSVDILKATKDGLEVYGKITATGGKIGGFTINSDALSYNNQNWGGTNTYGAYLGTSGIQLGKNFKVDMSGNLYAASGTFAGNVYAGNIQYGGSYGTLSGSGISSGSIYGNRMVGNTITTAYTSSGINNALSRAEASYDALFNNARAKAIACDQISADQILLGGKNLGCSTISYVGADGSNHSINVVTWSSR